jgi:hypothetical protein
VRALRQQRAEAQAKKRPAIRVRASVQPTFVRFVFEMPDGVGASSVLNDQKLTLSFNNPLTFDMADAKIAAPPNVASINQRMDGDTTLVDIALIGDVDVHPFREDKNYIVDVSFQQAEKANAQTLPAAALPPPADKTKTARVAPSAEKAAQEIREPVKAEPSTDLAPPDSESLARQMKTGGKPEAPPSRARAPPSRAQAPPRRTQALPR